MNTQLTAQEQEYEETQLGWLPKEWHVASLGNCLEKIRNGLTKRQTKTPISPPVSRIETISTGTINPEKVGYVEDLTDNDIANYKLEIDDILFSHINSEPFLGNTAIYRGTPNLLIHGMNLLLLRTKKEKLAPSFLNYVCKYYRLRGKFISIAGRAVNQSSINQGRLKSLQIPLPSLSEQQRIAFVLSTIGESQEKTENATDSLKELKKSLMKHLFTYGAVSFVETDNVELRKTELGMLPKEWDVKIIGEEFNIKSSSLTYQELEKMNDDKDDKSASFVMAVKVSDMNLPGNGIYFFRSNLMKTIRMADIEKKTIPKNSIIFPKRGAAIATNKKRISATKTVLDPNLISLTKKSDEVDVLFFFNWFQTFDLRSITVLDLPPN